MCANSSWRGNTEDNDTRILRTPTRTNAATFSGPRDTDAGLIMVGLVRCPP